ncbi:alpha/beta hydrolase [Acetobacter farinalis]|uniref:Alpha/beta hydrolase n=1 Tax=Acetobacter farinalis TaxID=1260984 RepID=A0ABT3Q7B3_9PROT|nr:alpha/beta hydrolase [Acetobacter farinalis]MCX2561136.1 alpha/beta hydrolase [Acetobacter farinalis]NHO29616.1 alpha/beta fold hydrolase [Acetobacter farinalis]
MRVLSNGISLHVDEQGKGKGELSLVFLHYWGGSSRTWKFVISDLTSTFHTVAIDHRGWGESEAPDSGYSLADMAADAEGIIATLNLRRYVLVGHSMGGKVAQLMASRRPTGLVGLILVAPSPPSPMALSVEAREMMAKAYDSRATIEGTIDHVLIAKPLSEEIREQVIEDSLKGAPVAKSAWPRATSQEDITEKVGNIHCPVLVIAGELDKVDKIDVLRSEVMTRLPQAKMHVLPGTGHLSMLESPREVATLIQSFCKHIF